MTNALQAAANARNGVQSTGPKTVGGKARSSKNALRHGLRSDLPVLPGERIEDWETHRAGVLRSLAPVGTLEQELSGRVVLCLWRLRRLAVYETATTAIGIEEVEERIRGQAEKSKDSLTSLADDDDDKPLGLRLARTEKKLAKERETLESWDGMVGVFKRLPRLPEDRKMDGGHAYGVFEDVLNTAYELGQKELLDAESEDFLTGLGVPMEQLDSAYEWKGWTAGMVRKGVACIANDAKMPPERLLALAQKQRQETQAERRETIKTLEKKAKALRLRVRVQEHRSQQRRMIPAIDMLDKITRYEAHLSRQMLQALHTLERLQAARAGQEVPVPAALDVTVDADASCVAQPAAQSAARSLTNVAES